MNLKIAALAAFLFAITGCTQFGPPANSFWVGGWQGLSGVALMIVGLLLTLGYLASVFFGDEKMKAWVKKEIGQLVFSVIILVAAVALAGSLDAILKTMSLASPDPQWSTYVNQGACCDQNSGTCLDTYTRYRPCHIEIASDYLQLLYESARLNAVSLLDNYWWYGFLSNLTAGIDFETDARKPELHLTPFAGLSMAGDYFSILFELASKTMIVLRAQQVLLDFIYYAFFPLMLSMGLVLRILYFTRKLGGLLIALALSTYIIFPMFYVVGQAILFTYLGGWTDYHSMTVDKAYGHRYDESVSPLPLSSGPLTGDRKADAMQTVNVDMICQEDTASAEQTGQVFQAFASSWNKYEYGRWYSQFERFAVDPGVPIVGQFGAFSTKGPIATLATIMVFSIVMPFLALMTMLASIKVFSPLLGGDVEISLLSRLI